MRTRRPQCSKCGSTARAAHEPLSAYAILVGDRWLARFAYPESPTQDRTQAQVAREWDKAEGILIAQSIRGVLGKTPFMWPATAGDSAAYTCKRVPGGVVEWFCSKCAQGMRGKAA